MIAISVMPYPLFVFFEITTMTTRDPIGAIDSAQLVRAQVMGIFTTMISIVMLPVVMMLLWFVWGQILTKGRLMRDIERYFDSP
jgi:heme/copper-type cytochrome/quinol oxidase subunit 2